MRIFCKRQDGINKFTKLNYDTNLEVIPKILDMDFEEESKNKTKRFTLINFGYCFVFYFIWSIIPPVLIIPVVATMITTGLLSCISGVFDPILFNDGTIIFIAWLINGCIFSVLYLIYGEGDNPMCLLAPKDNN